jgi:hypothetical protein
MTKALHLLEVGFTSRLDRVSAEISPKIAATQSESARHALAYGRFEELISESYSLLPNVRRVVLNAYDQFGNAKLGPNFDVYSNTVNSIFQAYLNVRDKDLRPIIQKDFDAFKAESKGDSVEPAARNLMKQCFERSYTEINLFAKIFSIEPQYNSDPNSAYTVLKSNQRSMVNPVNVVPIATNLQAALQPTDLQTICNVVGWAMNEYLVLEYDEDETGFTRHCRELTARLLTEHLWAYTDTAFEAEITRSTSKAPLTPESLTIGPVTNGVASSNAYPPVRRALELLIQFDQCMPKERCVSLYLQPLCHLFSKLTTPTATFIPGNLQNPPRIHNLPPPRRDTHPFRPQRHRSGPLHDQEPAHPQKRARLPRNHLRRNQPIHNHHIRRHAAFLRHLGLDPIHLLQRRFWVSVRAKQLHPLARSIACAVHC